MARPTPTLLVIGGGFAGTHLALKLQGVYDVTLVTSKKYFEVTYATVRSAVNPEFAKRTTIDYDEVPRLGRVVTGTVARLDTTSATLASGEVLHFDFVAICTGSSYSSNLGKSIASVTKAERLNELQGVYEQVKAAKSIVIIGGGASGVEYAAEIVEAFAGKALTVVGSGERLIPAMPPRCGNYAKKWLEKHGTTVLLGEKATVGSDPNTVVTSSGKQLQADMIIMATGTKVVTSFLDDSPLESIRNKEGLIKVDPFFQVEGHANIFALGDCTDIPEEKLAYLAGFHATLSEGVGRMGSCTCIGGFPVGAIKSKDLFVGKARGQLGLKA
ncbi:MAG: hypothetical protein WDW36_008548 [Sanguina aurantia]